MRFLIIVLLMVLLPLRGWTGDAMAISMAAVELVAVQQAPNATKNRAAQHLDTAASASFGSKTERQAMQTAERLAQLDTEHCGDHATPADPRAKGPCGSCALCVACHGAAIQTLHLNMLPASPSRPVPSLARQGFASADAALSQKPPIS